mgnify:FL=1|tara:strand:+ start:662 stop:853 length:192 start_codon:yes stop_codon:yes gene_type:complete
MKKYLESLVILIWYVIIILGLIFGIITSLCMLGEVIGGFWFMICGIVVFLLTGAYLLMKLEQE